MQAKASTCVWLLTHLQMQDCMALQSPARQVQLVPQMQVHGLQLQGGNTARPVPCCGNALWSFQVKKRTRKRSAQMLTDVK